MKHTIRMVLLIARVERGANRLHHLGSTAAAPPQKELLRRTDVLRCGRNRLREQHMRIAGERNQVERVAGIQSVKGKLDHFLRLLD
ncbi:MAG: hypothetical protein R2762_08960 [Bryobacteraceae bacterium]